MTPQFTDADIRRYLLGALPEPDREALEDAYFAEPDLLARVEQAQSDLTDDYAAGRLSSADQTLFAQRYLTSVEGRREAALAQVLRHASTAAGTNDVAPRRQTLPPWLLLAAAAVLVVGATYIYSLVNGRGPGAPAPTVPPPVAVTPAPPPPVEAPQLRVATLVLTADLSRGEGPPPTLVPAAELTYVDLVVPVEDGRSARRGQVTTVEGRPIWSGAIEQPSGQPPRARVPAAALPPGDYILSLGDMSSGAATYFFRVRRSLPTGHLQRLDLRAQTPQLVEQ